MNYNNDRKFGVEIEYASANLDRYDMAEAIRNEGVECYTEGYNHYTRNHWKIVTDTSCGSEIVSPPLKYEDMWQLEKVCKVLQENGTEINRNCSVHVHQDANDLNVKHFKNIANIYTKYNEGFDEIMPESRRSDNNQYCRSMLYDNSGFVCSHKEVLNDIKECKSIYDLTDLFQGRYYKVNFKAYLVHGTVEFRQHSATINFEKIKNWVMLTNCIVETAKTNSVKSSYNYKQNNFYNIARILGLYVQSGATELEENIRKFYVKRKKELRRA